MASPQSSGEGEDMRSLEAKVVVLGSQGVGKTSVVIRYVGNMFSKHVSPTIGASFFTYKMTLGNYRVKLQVWDTAGQERFRAMAPMYYRKANAAMLIYDITSSDTFYDIKDWVSELKRNVDTPIVMCLLGNKCDLEQDREVKKEDAQEYAASIDSLFFETSALNNIGVEEAFLEVAKKLISLCESSPNCGINLTDSQGLPLATGPVTQDSPNVRLPHSPVDSNFQGNLHGHNPSHNKNGCSC